MKNIIIISFYMLFTSSSLSQETDLQNGQKNEFVPENQTETVLEGSPCECKLDIDALKEIRHYPLYLYAGTDKIIYPKTEHNEVIIQTGESIEIHCTHPDGLFVGKGATVHNIQSLTMQCLYGWKFASLGKVVDLRHVGCVKRVEAIAKKINRQCGRKGTTIKVGYDLIDGTFLTQYTICFDIFKHIAQYTHSTLTPVAQNWFGNWRRKPRADFVKLKNATSKYYIPENVRHTINKQIGREPDDRWIIDEDRNMMLGRGHLVPTADYYYDFERRATLYYINMVPQWIHFNCISWNSIELAMRKYAVMKNTELDIYTGTLHQMSLRHMNRTLVRIFLTGDQNKLPVPLYLWKIVYDKKNSAGIAIIGVNNFFWRGKYMPLCDDVSPVLPWVTDKVRKYVYVCTIEEWLRFITKIYPDLPKFKPIQLIGINDFLLLGNKTSRRDKASKPKSTIAELFSKMLKFFGFNK